ncbi:LacI family DNA-binding transcriptional regulator [Caloramator sp. Dgby_cultured_2]|nr:LacI family DNA-binding transcriptional regulator [Caloramator sp. Dgby_cultured_2]WDU83445.1 LacI family DNA-binding transcriptional regulator [Caloramator sp. Dgby_cultured_2]
MVTIYDVAKEAGCSPAAVSKAFNNYKSVSEKTYKK